MSQFVWKGLAPAFQGQSLKQWMGRFKIFPLLGLVVTGISIHSSYQKKYSNLEAETKQGCRFTNIEGEGLCFRFFDFSMKKPNKIVFFRTYGSISPLLEPFIIRLKIRSSNALKKSEAIGGKPIPLPCLFLQPTSCSPQAVKSTCAQCIVTNIKTGSLERKNGGDVWI